MTTYESWADGGRDAPSSLRDVEVSAPTVIPAAKNPPQNRHRPTSKTRGAKKASNAFTPGLRVILRFGNKIEGNNQKSTHEADTLGTLLAEQEATRLARKKFRYVEVVS